GTLFSPRVAAPVFGLGLLEAVTDAEILSREDPRDADHDGISGRANHVRDEAQKRTVLGRFGWKANQPSVRQQNAPAALDDIGLTTTMSPRETVAAGREAAAGVPGGAVAGGVELRDDFLDRLTFYVESLAVPAPRFAATPDAARGASLFVRAGCAACHVPTL